MKNIENDRKRFNEINCFNSVKHTLIDPKDCKTLILDFANCDINEIIKIIMTTRKNPNVNIFPDFIFNEGFIEHFEFTSNKEDKKGSKEKRDLNNFDKECDDKLKDELSKQKTTESLIFSETLVSEGCSYENLYKSFTRNFKIHIINIEKSNYKYKCGIFLVEQTGALAGYMKNNKFIFHSFYMDYKFLTFLSQYKDKIKYVIHKYANRLEIIDLSKIDDLLVKCDLSVKWTIGRNRYVNSFQVLNWFPIIGKIK